MTTVYGIPNCDTVKRARAWLTSHGIAHDFHDFRKTGVPADRLDAWLASLGWQTLVNRNGTTWRQLADADRAAVHDDASARAVLLAHPGMIKRPVVAWGDGSVSVGFEVERWVGMLAARRTAQADRAARAT